ncbi:MAG: HAD family phosphatase [Anaerolineales bacterium]|nr:HAD family phosphatase [Anaerolineales bacterium]
MQAHNNQIKAIVFDFGGVLLDWKPHYLYRKFFADDRQIDAFLEEIGFAEWNQRQDQGRPFAEAVDLLAAQFPRYADLIRAYDERWIESIGGPIQSSVDLLGRFKDAGYPLFGLSNWSSEKFYTTRGEFPFFEWLDYILVSGDVKLVKPDPQIFQVFLENIEYRPEECLFIDDSQVNIETAGRLGFDTVWYRTPEQLEAEVSRRGLP